MLVSDYLKGTVTGAVVRALVEQKAPGTPVVVDPKIPHLACYGGATLVTPNHHEAEQATHRRIRTDDDAQAAARAFRAQRAARPCSSRAASTACGCRPRASKARCRRWRARSPTSPAPATRSSRRWPWRSPPGATLAEAAVLANHAAGVVVGKFGAATLTADELLDAGN